jgi:hypothetical protein
MGDVDIQSALREMAGQIGALGATVKSLESTWRSQEAAATEGRRELHRKFEAMADKVSTLSGRVEQILRDILNMQPIIDEVETAKQRAIGAGMLGKALWAIGGAMVAGGVWLLSHIK